MSEVFDFPRGMSSMFIILLLGFAFDCWIGKLGLGAADTLVFYFGKGEGGFGVSMSSFETPISAIFSLSEESIRMSG